MILEGMLNPKGVVRRVWSLLPMLSGSSCSDSKVHPSITYWNMHYYVVSHPKLIFGDRRHHIINN